MEKKTARLKNWFLGIANRHVYGEVYGHYRIEDGTRVMTSNIQNITKNEDEWIIETLNTIYICRLEDAA